MLVEHDATQCCKAPMDGFRQTAGTLTFGLAERVLEYLPDLLFHAMTVLGGAHAQGFLESVYA